MSNDKNNIMNDDEYHFPKDEYLHQATATADASTDHVDDMSEEKIVPKQPAVSQLFTRLPILKNKKFYFVAGFAVVIIVGLQMMHGGHKTQVVKSNPVVAQPTPVVVQPNSQLLNQLDSIKSNQTSNQNAMSSLQDNISGLKSQLTKASANNAELAQSVTSLTAEVKLLSDQVNANSKKLAPKPKKKTKSGYTPKPITYSLKAVVPGRAWLQSSDGGSYSVAVGDKLAQYGRVKAIDDNSGDVYTTSGKTISYGPNDS